MNKQDISRPRNYEDIMYRINQIHKNIQTNISQLTKINNELNNFVNITYANAMQRISEQIDGKITTWYYSGNPTLNNLPASQWNTDDLKLEHVGDLYYDKETGYAYIFNNADNVYNWEQLIDSDVTEALALANAAQDTADNKRRVFTRQPEPPYDNGDLWINDMEIYICQISKDINGSFEVDDFIIATKYTDDTIANKVNDELQIVKGTVLTIKDSVDEYKIQFDTTTTRINKGLQENIEALEQMAYTFNTDDLTIAKSNDPVNTRINNRGLKIYSFDELEAIFNNKGSGIQKLIVVGDAQLGNLQFVKATDDNGDACTDIHYLISNIQTLDDLED